MKRSLQTAVISLVLLAAPLALSQTPSTVPAGTEVLIGAPKRIPDGLLSALKTRLVKSPDVAEAYLAMIYVNREGEVPHFLLFLKIDDAPDFIKDLIRNDLGNASKAFLAEDESIDILTDNTPAAAAAVAQVVKPFYIRGKEDKK
ncbi:MAG TPA: enhanced serine sensitivity protein SseB C-terminal domain-containing protein [Candidatus Binatia bacterium]|nr:enhanced serine sensitivity protein SseB C-terminal domain-containing protein [Candidatus Binatia bacterium]